MEQIQVNPIYLQGDCNDIQGCLQRYFSNNYIKQKMKEKAIKVGRPHLDEVWIKLGKQLFIIQKTFSSVGTQAQVWWEYHHELMPRKIEWQTYQ